MSSGAVVNALRALPARELEAILLVAWDGLDPQRAARVVGCTPAAFRARLYRARRHLAVTVDPPARTAPGPREREEIS